LNLIKVFNILKNILNILDIELIKSNTCIKKGRGRPSKKN